MQGRATVFLVAALFMAGCGSGDDPTYWHDAKPILDGVCTRCHVQGGIAPMPLTTFDEAYPFRARIREEVEARIMPPWLPGPGCNEYAGDFSLSDDQVDTLVSWVDAGAPEGDPADAAPPLVFPQLDLSRVDLTLTMDAPYTPSTEGPDDFRCFVLEWPEQGTTYVTGFKARPGNPAIVHHVVTTVVGPAEADLARELADQDALPGYSCFGGDGVGGPMVGAWAPGIAGTDYPADTGILVEPGSVLVMQVHYNTIDNGGESDETSIDLRLDPAVSTPATMLTLVDPREFTSLYIPAGAPDVEFSYSAPIPAAGLVHFAAVHMHLLGNAGSLVIERGGGGSTCVLDVPRYDFHWQMLVPLAKPISVGPGDTLHWTCAYDNSAANQPMVDGVPRTPADVTWGEGTTDEMCVAVLYVTPE
jgi:hypothetical protein